MEVLANDAILDVEQAIKFTAKAETLAVKEPHPGDDLERRLQICNTVTRPVMDDRTNNVGVVTVDPVSHLRAVVRKSLRGIFRAVLSDGRKVGVKASDRCIRLMPGVVVNIAVRIDVLLEECLEYLNPNEYVEITPKSIRLRKSVLDEIERFSGGLCSDARLLDSGKRRAERVKSGSYALCDALLGALGEGDIGRHFPDTDPANAGIDSRALLRRVWEMVRARGLELGNADITLIAQAPKMAPHVPHMLTILALDCGVDSAQLNIKATTTEGLGFTGREEGIAVHAVVLLCPCN